MAVAAYVGFLGAMLGFALSLYFGLKVVKLI